MRKKKAPKPNAEQRALAASWEKLKASHSKILERGAKAKSLVPVEPVKPTRRKKAELMVDLPHMTGDERRSALQDVKSKGVKAGNATKSKGEKKYTGTEMLGIGQLHKSNAVPVFRTEDAVDLAKMRR